MNAKRSSYLRTGYGRSCVKFKLSYDSLVNMDGADHGQNGDCRSFFISYER